MIPSWLKYVLMAAWPVLTAFWIDMGSFSKAREEARKAGKPLPSFDWAVALPRYATGLIGGAMSVATTFLPELA